MMMVMTSSNSDTQAQQIIYNVLLEISEYTKDERVGMIVAIILPSPLMMETEKLVPNGRSKGLNSWENPLILLPLYNSLLKEGCQEKS